MYTKAAQKTSTNTTLSFTFHLYLPKLAPLTVAGGVLALGVT